MQNLYNNPLMNPQKRILHQIHNFPRFLQLNRFIRHTTNCHNTLVASWNRLPDLDLHLRLHAKLLHDLAAATDYAPNIADETEDDGCWLSFTEVNSVTAVSGIVVEGPVGGDGGAAAANGALG